MTTTSTADSEFLLLQGQAPDAAHSAQAPARAVGRARPVTPSSPVSAVPAAPAAPARPVKAAKVKKPPRERPVRPPRPARPPLRIAARLGLTRWWLLTSRPTSLAATWRLSAVNRDRIPLGSSVLALIWRLANWTERLIFFGLVAIAPTVLTGPLRWLAARPTRRWAFYLVTAAFAATFLPDLLHR